MTSDQIKAELRRSACEDVEPSYEVDLCAVDALERFVTLGEAAQEMVHPYQDRIFFLLVAEAL